MANKKISELTLFATANSTDEIPVNRLGMSGKLTAASLAGVPTSRTITTISPLSGGGDLSSNLTLSITNAQADSSSKGVAAFTASDFNSASGVISIDYVNGQSASATTKGFLTAAHWSTFNGKQDVIGHLEYNNTDLTIWNNGKGNITSNTSFGDSALKLNTTGNANTAFGTNTLANITTGTGNTAFGNNALSASNANTTNNTAIGASALANNTTGTNNTSLGYYANTNNSTGSNIVAIGTNASNLGNNGNSVIIGKDSALYTIGPLNVAVGTSSLRGSVISASAGANVALGYNSMFTVTTAANNVAVGFESLKATTTGIGNIGIGSSALSTNTTGEKNTAIGADTDSGNFSYSVILGASAIATANNQFVVGSTTYNAGSVVTEPNTSTKVWNVVINGVARKILLA